MQKIELYEHNRTAYEKVEDVLAEHGKAAVIHPTGTGKSFIAFTLVEAHPDKLFLWLAPSEYIYSLQTEKLRKKQGIAFSNIEFHTYAWLMRNEDLLNELNPDYIILDEFHRAGALEWGKSVEKLIHSYPDARLFGMSATNVRYLDNQRDMADELFEGCIASEMSLCEAMARHILPEPKYVISVYSYEAKLLEWEEQAARLKNNRQKSKAQQLIEKLRRRLQQADGLGRVFEKHMPRRNAKVIVFCTNAEHMQEIMEKSGEWFHRIDEKPHTYSVYTYNPDAEKEFQSFIEDDSDHLKLLYCIDMLNEGIHVDDVDAVVLCRPTVSPIVYKQQIGRAIAAGSTKQPVIFDMVNNFDNLYQIDALREELEELTQFYNDIPAGGDYELGRFEVVDELRNCRELMDLIQRNLDMAWDIYYQELCRYVKENGTARVPRRYATDDGLFLGKWMQRQRALYNENKLPETKIKLMESIGVVWEADSDEKFAHWIELLKQYKEEHGDLKVPSRYVTADGGNLGNWCYNIRTRYRKGRVTQDRIDILNGMGFAWETFGLYWEEGYEHAKAYYKEHGDLDAIKRYVCEDGFKLGLWLYTQRAVRSGKVPGNLTKEKIEKLDAIGMVWVKRANNRFTEYLKAFEKYKESHKEPFIPFDYVDPDGMQLGQWAARMNRQYYAGKLPKEKEQKLLEVGFAFHSFSNQWGRHYAEAESYYRANGDLHVPISYTKEHGVTLAQWINNQRREYRKDGHGKLSADQVELLEAIGIAYGSRVEKNFDRGVEAFRDYVAKYHDSLVPSEYTTPDGYNLGRWLCHQREKYNNGELTEEQIKVLSEAGMIWENTEKVRAIRYWNVMYETAKQYADSHGSLKGMPFDYTTKDGRKLGSWVAQQRRIRKGTIKHSIELDEEKIGMLDAIGMNWGRSAVTS